jgi:hypothetical protein
MEALVNRFLVFNLAFSVCRGFVFSGKFWFAKVVAEKDLQICRD